jgi:hypothetical protein
MDSVDAGSESEEDKRLSRELDLQISKKRVDPLRNAKLADHLNLLWSVSQVRRKGRLQGHFYRYLLPPTVLVVVASRPDPTP